MSSGARVLGGTSAISVSAPPPSSRSTEYRPRAVTTARQSPAGLIFMWWTGVPSGITVCMGVEGERRSHSRTLVSAPDVASIWSLTNWIEVMGWGVPWLILRTRVPSRSRMFHTATEPSAAPLYSCPVMAAACRAVTGASWAFQSRRALLMLDTPLTLRWVSYTSSRGPKAAPTHPRSMRPRGCSDTTLGRLILRCCPAGTAGTCPGRGAEGSGTIMRYLVASMPASGFMLCTLTHSDE
mmetsp:Transcript_33525/g.74176  ORF Transcript_33525/g.74176 Transcript_33525/m.74176 type:complete len:239 (+) Transcript_33525:389-1105(+)